MTVQKIRFAQPGSRLTARHYNQVVEGANLALEVLGPPRSNRLPSADSNEPVLDDTDSGTVTGLGTQIFVETSRITSTVRVEDPNDASVYVDVERIDQVTLRSGTNVITLIFDNS